MKSFSLFVLLSLLALPAGALTTSGEIHGAETWSGTVTLTGAADGSSTLELGTEEFKRA